MRFSDFLPQLAFISSSLAFTVSNQAPLSWDAADSKPSATSLPRRFWITLPSYGGELDTDYALGFDSTTPNKTDSGVYVLGKNWRGPPLDLVWSFEYTNEAGAGLLWNWGAKSYASLEDVQKSGTPHLNLTRESHEAAPLFFVALPPWPQRFKIAVVMDEHGHKDVKPNETLYLTTSNYSIVAEKQSEKPGDEAQMFTLVDFEKVY